MNYNIHFSCVSHIGSCRSINQDNFICDGQYMEIENDNIQFPLNGCAQSKTTPVFGIFDGMGGEECGEMAAYIAAKSAAGIKIGKDAAADIFEFCMKTNEKICQNAEKHSISAMGTTAAMLVFSRKEIVLCNIGDSRIFQFSNGVLNQISHDHTMIAAYGTKAPLSQNLGIPSMELRIEPYITKYRYKNGDIYLICSDGLTDMVEIKELMSVLYYTDFNDITKEMLNKALANGGRDNVSVIACRIE